MPEMCSLTHNNYDRITDKVMWLGFGVTLNFNVDLYFQRKNNVGTEKIKENFHREIIYKSIDVYKAKIIRDFNYYFSIDYNLKEVKERVLITPDQIYFFIFNLKKIMKWFIGENGVNTIFKKNNGKIFIPTHPEPIKISLAFGAYIEFEPAINNDPNGYETIGVKVYLNRDSVFFFMDSNTLFSLYHMVSTCNMYALAQNILNYIGRPEYGTNAYNLFKSNSNLSTGKCFFNMVGASEINNP